MMKVAYRSVVILGLMAVFFVCVQVRAETSSYILGAGDKLRITVFGEKELSGDFVISAMNNLSLPLIGEVSTQSADIRVLQNRVVTKLENGYLVKPQVSIEVLEYRPFYILGNVRDPGSYAYVNGMTILNAIALAGGFEKTEQDDARLRVQLTRAREDVQRLKVKYHSSLAEEARFVAERDLLDQINYPRELTAQQSDPEIQAILTGEERIFQSRRSAYEVQIAGLKEKHSQYDEVVIAVNLQSKADLQRLKLLQSEITDLNKLLKKGYARKPQLTKLKRQAAEVESDLASNREKMANARQRISEAKLRVSKLKDDYFNQTIRKLHEVRQNIADIELQMRADTDVLSQIRFKIAALGGNQKDEKSSKTVITRLTTSGSLSIDVLDDELVLPGDIIRVPGAHTFSSKGKN